MKDEQKLAKIRAKCEELINRAAHGGPGANILDIPAFPAAIAGWVATISAIDGLSRLSNWNFAGWEGDQGIIAEIDCEIDNIIAAWEGAL